MIEPNSKEPGSNALLDVLALSKDATAIYTSEDLHIAFANDKLLGLWGKQRNIIGTKLTDALPELKDAPFFDLLKNVWRTGKTYAATATPATLEVDGEMVTSYFDFEYRPIFGTDGKTQFILHTTADVTEAVKAKQALKEKEDREQQLSEELTAANEELGSMNDELSSLNEEYLATNEELKTLNEEHAVINEELTSTNEALNEINDENAAINDKLNRTNEALNALNEEIANINKALNVKNDELNLLNEELGALNEEYTAANEELKVLNEENQVLNEELTSANEELQVGNDELEAINDQLNALNDQLALARNAAGVGMFDLDVVNDKLDWDERCKQLFGVDPDKKVTYTTDFVNGLFHEDKERVLNAVADAFNQALTDGHYDVNYRTVSAANSKLRWVRAVGRVYFNSNAEPQRFIGVVIDISEQKRDEERKNDFIGMVSHELKTPLTTLNAQLQMLQIKAKRTGDDYTIGALERSVRQIKKMTNMINGFLNVSRLESGKINIDLREFDINQLLYEAEEEVLNTIESHKVVFELCNEITINADKDKVGQVITNFISNAVKYSPKGSTITVKCTTDAGALKVEVSDEGMGIAPEDQEKLFDRYYRVQNNQTHTISGFGIGLYLCAEIIEHHGGHIGVTSVQGKGSTFWFSLPLK